ncbi:retropepsin-like aspartic protease, partial [Aspergillus neoniger CBS 115656]
MEQGIKEAAQQCVDLFTQCLQNPPLMENEWAENRLADMNLWISGTGACARGRASLDSRLASRPEAHDVIFNLLRLLSTMIDECLKRSKTQDLSRNYHNEEDPASSENEREGRTFSPWSDDSSSDGQLMGRHELRNPSGNLLYESIYDIESMMDQLSRVAVAIRRSGRRSRLQKADQLFNATEHQELEGHLIEMLLCQLNGRIQERDPSQLDEVQLRLVHCNLKRRNRFLYSQRHAMGLDAGYVRRTPVPKPAGSAQKETPQGSPCWESSNNSPMHANNTVITGTSASRLSDGFHLPQPGHTLHQTDHAISITSSAVSTTALEVDYPRPPQLKDDARLFRCPCCCEALPAKMTDEIRWRKHIEDDLSPYSCVLASCDQPYVLFNTKDSWRQHMLKDHNSMTYWTCFACDDGSQFSNREAFVQHTESFHAATVPVAHIPVLVELSKKTIPSEIRHCPLCNWPEDDEVEVEKDAQFNHIAKEVHSFSLRALPWADDNGQESVENIHNSSEKVYDWLSKNNIPTDPSIERPPCKERLWYDDYFQQNSYFACSSEASSSNELDSDKSRQKELDELRRVNEIESQGQKSEANANPALHSSPSNTQGDYIEQAEELETPMDSREVKLSEEHSETQQTPSIALSDIVEDSEDDFSEPAYFWGHSSKKAVPVYLDTKATANIMSLRLAQELEAPLQPITPKALGSIPSDAANQTSLTAQFQTEVNWQFARRGTEYTAKFLVLDTDTYDVVLGMETISKYELLQPPLLSPVSDMPY